MTRRITRTMVAVVAGALLLTTLGTVLLLRLDARAEARSELAGEAERIAARLETFQREGVLPALVTARALEGGTILRIQAGGRVAGALPAGLTADDLDLRRLRAGQTYTGSSGSLVFGAAGAVRGNVVFAVILTRRVGNGIPAAPWIALVAASALAVTAVVAANLGRRLTRPIREAQEATQRVAGGDLAARVAVSGSGDDELGDLARSINAMAASLERSRGLERQFLLSVSHDLRTPLTSIRGYADALAEGRDPDPAHAAGVIGAEARRLERLVNDLLELARLDARRFSLQPRPIDAAEVLAEIVDGFGPAAAEAGVDLSFSAPAGPLWVVADPDRLAQAVANLVENALRFTTAEITVAASAAGASVSITVDDDGPGLAQGDATRVFEPFYQGARTPARTVGTGLGLAIVHELVEAMGGTVAASDRAGGGGRFTVGLPASPAQG